MKTFKHRVPILLFIGLIFLGTTVQAQWRTQVTTKYLVVNKTVDINLGSTMHVDGALTDFGTGSYAAADGDNDVGIAGDLEVDGIIDADGGIKFPSMSAVLFAKGGQPITTTSPGGDTAPTNGPRWITEITIPYSVTLTGGQYLIGSVGGTDSVIVDLYNSAGTLVASSDGGGAADLVGSSATIQSVAFDATYLAHPGTYYVSLQFNGTTARFRAYNVTGSKFIALTAAGTFSTPASITPGSTWTTAQGPVSGVY